MTYFLATEHLDNGHTITLISLALAGEDGRELYVQVCEAPIDADRYEFYTSPAHVFSPPDPWLVAHVLPQLDHQHCLTPCEAPGCPWLHQSDVADYVLGFLDGDPQPEFWGYHCAYDWVALCQLFGPLIDRPAGWPCGCRDLRQWLDQAGLAHVRPPTARQHALTRARGLAQTWQRASTAVPGILGGSLRDKERIP